jgi:hypothetical protein
MACVMHAQEKKTQADIIMMNTALADIFLEAMSSQTRASFQQRCLCEPNIIFVDLFLWFVNQYAKMTAKDCKANWQRMAAGKFPYRLNNKVLNGYVYMKICKGMYGLPQAGILANKLLKKCLRATAHTGFIQA